MDGWQWVSLYGILFLMLLTLNNISGHLGVIRKILKDNITHLRERNRMN